VYDLDDIEDGESADDGVSTQGEYDQQKWFYDQDVEIILEGLVERTDYPYIYCYAEDDEDILGGMVWDGSWYGSAKTEPNKMLFDTSNNQGPQNVHTISQDTVGQGILTVRTLDESPPVFDALRIEDPTAADNAIAITFTLNEDGTAYCRVTRSDSGETNLKINRILTADWSAVYLTTQLSEAVAADKNSYITIDQLEDATYSDYLDQQQEYDIYCWAKDSAVDTATNPRPNYQTQAYVNNPIVKPDGVTDGPRADGGATHRVWVSDLTPPTMIYVSGEAIAEDTIQLTLQLDEPGTIWCTPVRFTGVVTGEITENDYGSGAACSDVTGAGLTYFEDCIKGGTVGAGTAIFREYVPEAYRNVDLEMNRVITQDKTGSTPLTVETDYKYMCFAEDDWSIQAPDTTNGARSLNFALYGKTLINNPVDFTTSGTFKAGIGDSGRIRTLDLTPPVFSIATPDLGLVSTTTETDITVTLQLDEIGTAWCKSFATISMHRLFLRFWTRITPVQCLQRRRPPCISQGMTGRSIPITLMRRLWCWRPTTTSTATRPMICVKAAR
jgi:hypothetical protein